MRFAAVICYLASRVARYTTEACLDVDCGYAAAGRLPVLDTNEL